MAHKGFRPRLWSGWTVMRAYWRGVRALVETGGCGELEMKLALGETARVYARAFFGRPGVVLPGLFDSFLRRRWSGVEAELLAGLLKLRALSLKQAADLYGKGAYRAVERLEEKGLVRVKPVEPGKGKCVVLTAEGYARASGDGFSSSYRSPRSSEVRRALVAAEFYVRAVGGGLPPDRLVPRSGFLRELPVSPGEVPFLLWMVDGWAVHVPWKKRHAAPLEREVGLLPAFRVSSHLVVYGGNDAFARACRRYASAPPSASLHLLTLDEVPSWASWLSKELPWTEDVGRAVSAAFPGASLSPAPPGSPGACLMRVKRDTLVVDMRWNRVGALALISRVGPSGLERRGWGSGAIFLFRDLAQLKFWSARTEAVSWALLESEPGAVFRVSAGKPELVRTRGGKNVLG